MLTEQVLQVPIPSKAKQYPIYIGSGILNTLSERIKPALPKASRLLVITDENVEAHWGEKARKTLAASGLEITWHVVPAGEPTKNLAQIEALYDVALNAKITRHDGILALGGGVIGDLTGFLAATYYRGTPFIQVPTTLLAQVDSSVGGKVAVNFKTVKNGIGAFYQPALVLADLDTLNTLPTREHRAGLAEVVKYGLLEHSACCKKETQDSFFEFLEKNADQLETIYPELVRRCCEIKASVVMQDETEQAGIRMFLNLGHTFAHAYEAAAGYGTLLHGEAVSIGILNACQLATELNLFPAESTERYRRLAERLQLPLQAPDGLKPKTLLSLMRQDKKNLASKIKFILPEGRIGEVRAHDDIPDETILKILS